VKPPASPRAGFFVEGEATRWVSPRTASDAGPVGRGRASRYPPGRDRVEAAIGFQVRRPEGVGVCRSGEGPTGWRDLGCGLGCEQTAKHKLRRSHINDRCPQRAAPNLADCRLCRTRDPARIRAPENSLERTPIISTAGGTPFRGRCHSHTSPIGRCPCSASTRWSCTQPTGLGTPRPLSSLPTTHRGLAAPGVAQIGSHDKNGSDLEPFQVAQLTDNVPKDKFQFDSYPVVYFLHFIRCRPTFAKSTLLFNIHFHRV